MDYNFTYWHKTDIILTYYRHKSVIIVVFWYLEAYIMLALRGVNLKMRVSNH